ncbi:MAG: hypothetical protein M1113_00280, partial [Candidatus Thermoplasmatota archaeon]|nr:hypothetical protein [Candidatus Thermoplasmatota archaeon]
MIHRIYVNIRGYDYFSYWRRSGIIEIILRMFVLIDGVWILKHITNTASSRFRPELVITDITQVQHDFADYVQNRRSGNSHRFRIVFTDGKACVGYVLENPYSIDKHKHPKYDLYDA